MIVSINCAGKMPDSYKELMPIFQKQDATSDPDIVVIGL